MVRTRPVARTFRRGLTWVSDVYVYMHKHWGSGHAPPEKLDALRLLLRPLWEQKQSRSSYTWFAQYCVQFLAVRAYAFASQLTSNFCDWQNCRWGDITRKTTDELASAGLNSDLFTHVFMRVLA